MIRRQRIGVPLILLTAGITVFLLNAATSKTSSNWAAAGALAVAREGACSVALTDGRILVVGGRNTDGVLANVDIADLDGNVAPASPMANPRSGQSCSVLPDGKVMVAGGATNGGPTNVVEIY